jgi:hypothetical protein
VVTFSLLAARAGVAAAALALIALAALRHAVTASQKGARLPCEPARLPELFQLEPQSAGDGGCDLFLDGQHVICGPVEG